MTKQGAIRLFCWLILGGIVFGSGVFPAAAQPQGQNPQGKNSPQAATIEISGAPLRILVNPDNSLQVYHQKYTEGATFGSAGSGFFIAVGQTSYGPPTTGAAYNAFETTSHRGPTGNGGRGSPFRVITQQQLTADTTALELVQTLSYTNGDSFFQLDWQITNTGKQRTCLKAYHAADLYFANDDYGIGYYNARTGSVGGFNQQRDWFMVFTPRTPATHYEENSYSTIWSRVGAAADLQDTIVSDYLDNGAALQWNECLDPGRSVTVGDIWSFGVNEAQVIQPAGASEGFRQAGPLTPEITTHIPTPLDISTDPKVIGFNLLLAAIATLMFTIAQEVLNRVTTENESFFQGLMRPLKWLDDLSKRISIGDRLKHPIWYELIKLVLVALVYGFVYSLLDATWNPLSITGLYLFFTMTLAFGIVGLADDLVQWLTVRRWKLAAVFNIRPGNLLLIVASTAFSRTFGLLPGIMFGSPEAFDVDSEVIDQKRQYRLLAMAAGILTLLLLISWLPTIVTALILRSGLPALVLIPVGAIESFLLLTFAITVQNIFLQMLTLPGTIGQALARWSRIAWFFGFTSAVFMFLHLLLNPQGDLAKAINSTNIRFFLGTIVAFIIFTFLVWLFFKVLNALTHRSVPVVVSPQQASAEVDKLISAWKTTAPEGRAAMLDHIASLGEAAMPRALAYLNHADPIVRQAATAILGRVGNASAIQPLSQALNDADPGVQQLARPALDQLNQRLANPRAAAQAAARPQKTSACMWILLAILLMSSCCLALVAAIVWWLGRAAV